MMLKFKKFISLLEQEYAMNSKTLTRLYYWQNLRALIAPRVSVDNVYKDMAHVKSYMSAYKMVS